MSIDCIFKKHSCREACEGDATTFFQSARGTVWPLCDACAEQHKTVSVRLAKQGRLAALPVAGATYDIPLDNPEILRIWNAQDPKKVLGIVAAVDKVTRRQS